jgi:hypothetical protein
VEGLVHAGLARTGVQPRAETAERLAGRALDVARRGLAHAVESGRIQRLFDSAGVANLVLKGAAVEMLAYGQLGRKDAWDIDLLVSPADVGAARDLLEAAGYALVQPMNLRPAQFRTFVDLARECEFTHRDSGITVELHWGLADGPVLLPHMSVASPSQWVSVTDTLRLRTLAWEESFAYLCVHGGMHGWSRLKWLADLAALAARESPDGVEHLYRRSRALGAGLCPVQALLLCERLLGLEIRPPFLDELRRVRGASWLVRIALETMAGGGERELETRPLASTRVLMAQFALGGSWAHAVAQLRYRAVSVHDLVYTPLPNGLGFLYPILRAPLWLWRRLAS